MKHIKLFENFNNINLILKFNNPDEYFKAIEYFKDDSKFFPNEYDSEFLSMSFSCTDQEDADATEIEIQNELDENGFSNFYFESEDGEE